MNHIKQQITDHAINTLGFDDCRYTNPILDESFIGDYVDWLNKGYHADMDYLERHFPFKEDPTKLLENASSAIVLIKNYKNTPEQSLNQPIKIARYAAGEDYHQIISQKLELLSDYICTLNPKAEKIIVPADGVLPIINN